MSTIILAWEYERDPSHIARLYRLQKQLLAMGHKAYLIGTHLPPVQDASLPFLPAPQANLAINHKSVSMQKIGGFSDRLALMGFHDAKILHTLVTAWDHLFDLLQPDLLITDSAPVANLAAYQTMTCIQVSDGLSFPPDHLVDFPRLRPDVAPLMATKTLMQNVHYVQSQRKKNTPLYLPCIFQSSHHFICHLPEFDPYLTFRHKSVKFGPSTKLPVYPNANQRDYFFAFLDKQHPHVEEIAVGLSEVDKQGIFYIPGASSALQNYLTTAGMMVCDKMPALDEIIAKCSWVVHHGNISVAETALAAGIPQFTLPYHFESEWVSQHLIKLGVGMAIHQSTQPIKTTIAKIKEGHKKFSLREWATLRAQHLKQKKLVSLESAILDACQHWI